MTNMADVSNKALDTVTGFAHQLTELAQQQAPAAWELAKGVARVSAGAGVFYGIGFLIFSIIAAKLSKRLWRWAKRVDPDGDNPTVAVPFFVGLVSCGFLVASLGYLLDIWNWVGLFYPELWIAHGLLRM